MSDDIKFRMGEYVEARKDASQPFRVAQIVAVHKQTGLYDAAFLDKGEALDISVEHIRKTNDPRNEEQLPTPRKEDVQLKVASPKKSNFPFKVGEQVEALRENKELWRFGVIATINEEEQTVDVIYSDHFRENKLPLNRVRSFNLAPDSTSNQNLSNVAQSPRFPFSVGMPVEARYQGGSLHYPAVVLKIDKVGGKVDLLYEDGLSESNVPIDLVKKRGNGQSASSSPSHYSSQANQSRTFAIGSKVEVNYRSRGKFYPAVIKEYRPDDGSYDIDYDDGEKESRVPLQNIRLLKSSSDFTHGQKVEVNYRAKGKYFPAKIRVVRDDGTYDIDYDDGEVETRVEKSLIRPLEQVSLQRKVKLNEGAKVEVNYRGMGKYFPGRIRRDRGDGTYDIDYEDGESELRVKEDYIKLTDANKVTLSGSSSLAVGTKVEGNYRGKGKFYLGTIKALNDDGTYVINYDDGEIEKNVKSDLIRVSAVSQSPTESLREGMKVEANYRGRGKFYPGKVKKVNDDGSYEIDYDDGECENNVSQSNLRVLGSSPRVSGGKFNKGAKIEANYRGQGKFFPGRIARDREDGTYDVDYDDGETELKVKEVYIRLLPEKLKEGMKVEGNYRGRGRWFPARIKRELEDGTYDLDYDDGESEKGVVAQLIRRLGGEVSNDRGAFVEGAKIEANYRGSGRYFPGKLARVRGDGSFDIDYDDGEKEHRVREDWIRLPGNNPKDGPIKFDVGMKVECNFRKRGNYFPGKIHRVRDNGTYDVEYDDGLMDEGVDAEDVRLIEVTFTERAKIEANYRGRGKYYPGRIQKVCGEGYYDIDYDDGESELHVHFRFIRAMKIDPRFNIGLVVETDYSSILDSDNFRSGKITFLTISDEGVFYSIGFFDGTSEQNIPESRIRLPRLVSKPPADENNQTANSVSRPPAGKPTSVAPSHSTNTHSNGYQESPLKHRRVKEASPVTNQGFGPSQFIKIEGNYQNTNTWLSAKIIKENVEEETVDIQYEENGEIETHIPLNRIRLTMQHPQLSSSASDRGNLNLNNATTDVNDSTHLFQLYSLVEVKDFRIGLDSRVASSAGPKWLKGRIITIDYEQELASIRLIGSNELLENVTFEEVRLLRTASGSGNNSRSHSASSSAGNLGEGNDDATQLKLLLQEKNVEIQQLRNTVQLLEQQKFYQSTANGKVSPTSSGGNDMIGIAYNQRDENREKLSRMEEKMNLLVSQFMTSKKNEIDLATDVQTLQSRYDELLNKLKEKKLI